MGYAIGIDIGGTGIKAGLVAKDFKIVRQMSIPTLSEPGRDDGERVTNAVEKLMRELCQSEGLEISEIDAVGIGCPGTVDSKNGEVVYANNINLANLMLQGEIYARTGHSPALGNDADMAAYGEHVAGGSKGCKTSLMITLGTGVGGGFILNNRIYEGYNSRGAEFGHVVVDYGGEICTCGRHGCLEAYASATGLIRMSKEAMSLNSGSIMWEICGGDISLVDGKTAFDAAEKGDLAGKETVEKYIKYLACGLASFINILHPEIICVGGGISKSGDDLLLPLKTETYKEVFGGADEKTTKIVLAKLGSDAGVVGAAVLGRVKMGEEF